MLTSRSQIWYTIFVGAFGADRAPRHLPGLPLISYATVCTYFIIFMQSLQKLTSKAWQLKVIIYAIRVYDIKAINDMKFIAKALKLKILTFQWVISYNSLHYVVLQVGILYLLEALQLRVQQKLCRHLVRLVLFNQHKTLCKDGAAFFNSGGHGHIGPPNKKVRGPSPH